MAEPVTYSGAFGSMTANVDVGPSDANPVTLLEKTAPSGILDEAGTILSAEFYGDFLTNGAPPSLDIVIYYGATALATVSFPASGLPTSSPNDPFYIKARVVTRSSGTVYTFLEAGFNDVTNVQYTHVRVAQGTASPTTTGEVTVKVTAEWGASDANNDLDVQYGQFKIEGVGAV